MKIIQLKTYRIIKERKKQEERYRIRLLTMDKASLLQELLHYHESYERDPHDVNVTIRGSHLMDVLAQRAELSELEQFSKEFQLKLRARLYKQLKWV